METAVKRLYEGMFLVDSALAAQDWQKILDEIQRVLDRAGADVVSLRKWDDRRLCYEVQGKVRGTYILTYFNCETDKIGALERDVQLSELITRVLVLRTDRMTASDMEGPTPLEAVAAEEAEQAAAAAARAEAAEAAKAAESTEEEADVTEAPTTEEAEVSAEQTEDAAGEEVS